MVGKQLNHCAQCGFEAAVCLAEAVTLDAKATGLKLGTGLGGRVAFEARSTDRTGRLNQECLSRLVECIKHSAPSQCTLILCNRQSALRTVLM